MMSEINKKYDLKDVTFLLLIRIDTIERLENIVTVTEFLTSNFDTNIVVWEVASYNNRVLMTLLNKEISYAFLEDDDNILYRTKYLNQMMKASETPYVAVWDVDVIAPAKQICETMSLLRQDITSFVYPYTGDFLDTGFIIRKLYLKKGQIEFLEENADKMTKLYPPNPLGGAFFCELDAYIDLGLENDEFYGWGVEDGERFHRWRTSRYKIERVRGALFHLTHPRSINSRYHHYDQRHIKMRLLDATIRRGSLQNINNKK